MNTFGAIHVLCYLQKKLAFNICHCEICYSHVLHLQTEVPADANNVFALDPVIPNLLVFPSSLQLNKMGLYLSSQLIIQDKVCDCRHFLLNFHMNFAINNLSLLVYSLMI